MTSSAVRQLLRDILRTPIAAQKNGKVHTISLLRAIILKQAQKAAAGDTRAARFMLESADKYLASSTRRAASHVHASDAPTSAVRPTRRQTR